MANINEIFNFIKYQYINYDINYSKNKLLSLIKETEEKKLLKEVDKENRTILMLLLEKNNFFELDNKYLFSLISMSNMAQNDIYNYNLFMKSLQFNLSSKLNFSNEQLYYIYYNSKMNFDNYQLLEKYTELKYKFNDFLEWEKIYLENKKFQKLINYNNINKVNKL